LGFDSTSNVTGLLRAWSAGDAGALERLVPILHGELKRIASRHMARERKDHTLQPTALVNEAFLRLVDQTVDWRNRAQFFGIAARLMRQILVDHARHRGRAKRGGEQVQVALDEALDVAQTRDADLVALDEALTALAQFDPQQSRVVELRYFGGLTIAETAEVLGVSDSTVEREWNLARAWLLRELSKE